MKRIVLILLIFLLALSGWAAPKYKLLLVNTGYGPPQEKIIANFMAKNPDIEVTMIARDTTQGSLTVDALMAKGTPPDVWLDAAGYFLKYLNADYALPLEKYIDVSLYYKHLVDPYTREGHVYALPETNILNALAVNLDMLKTIGYTLPAQPDWTTDEFIRLSARLKAAGIPSTMIMTQSGLIGWNMPWLYAFGAELYKNFDHSKVTINTPEAVKGLEYMKMLVDKGYAYPHPNELNDDMGVDLFTTARVFSCMMQNEHQAYWIPEQIKNGMLEKAFELTFLEFPHAPGRAHTPVSGYQVIVVAHRSNDEERNKAVIELFKTQVGREYQEMNCEFSGGFPTLIGLEPPNRGASGTPAYRAIAKIAATAGLMDLASLETKTPEINRAWKEPIQAFMNGKLTAQQVLDRFEKEAKVILAK